MLCGIISDIVSTVRSDFLRLLRAEKDAVIEDHVGGWMSLD